MRIKDYINFKNIDILLDYYGDIEVVSSNIDSLDGSPKYKIKGNFNCGNNNLKTLQFSPRIVEGDFKCLYNYLKNLEGSPELVYGNFDCRFNKLESLKGDLKLVKGDFNCRNNPKLKNIDFKKEIIENQIRAKNYLTDNCDFNFEEIKEEFEKYRNYLKNKEEELKNINQKYKSLDYGLSV